MFNNIRLKIRDLKYLVILLPYIETFNFAERKELFKKKKKKGNATLQIKYLKFHDL